MSSEPIPPPIVNQGFEDRWAAWRARGEANDRATMTKLVMMVAIFMLTVAIASALSLFR